MMNLPADWLVMKLKLPHSISASRQAGSKFIIQHKKPGAWVLT
jgi:hypothetical protein